MKGTACIHITIITVHKMIIPTAVVCLIDVFLGPRSGNIEFAVMTFVSKHCERYDLCNSNN